MYKRQVYIPLTFTEQEAIESLGGKDSVLYKQFFNALSLIHISTITAVATGRHVRIDGRDAECVLGLA